MQSIGANTCSSLEQRSGEVRGGGRGSSGGCSDEGSEGVKE
jgi:hypothetical protein